MSRRGDAGARVVHRLFEQLQIDDEWAVRDDRGFTWWSYRLAQHVRADPLVGGGDRQVSTVRIWTDVVDDVGGEADPAAVVGAVNQQQTMNALVWDPDARRISECCTAVVHDDNESWIVMALTVAALLQNAAAHSRAHALARVVGGVPAASMHPGGERPDMDEVLDIPEKVLAAEGRAPSVFAGDAMSQLGDLLPRLGLLGFADDKAFTCEVPFTGARPVAVVMASDEPPETSLLRVFTDQPHPQLGHGALIVLTPPLSFDPDQVATLANELNRLEALEFTDTALLGAWCPDPTAEGGVAHTTFLPNALRDPMLLVNLALVYQGARSRWAASVMT